VPLRSTIVGVAVAKMSENLGLLLIKASKSFWVAVWQQVGNSTVCVGRLASGSSHKLGATSSCVHVSKCQRCRDWGTVVLHCFGQGVAAEQDMHLAKIERFTMP
jgi:hypothetical protein